MYEVFIYIKLHYARGRVAGGEFVFLFPLGTTLAVYSRGTISFVPAVIALCSIFEHIQTASMEKQEVLSEMTLDRLMGMLNISIRSSLLSQSGNSAQHFSSRQRNAA